MLRMHPPGVSRGLKGRLKVSDCKSRLSRWPSARLVQLYRTSALRRTSWAMREAGKSVAEEEAYEVIPPISARLALQLSRWREARMRSEGSEMHDLLPVIALAFAFAMPWSIMGVLPCLGALWGFRDVIRHHGGFRESCGRLCGRNLSL